MKPLLSFAFILVAVALTGCGENKYADATSEPPAAEKHDGNIVTLTPANLAHVTITTELVQPGRLDLTLKAVGRVSENLNKTAKVTSTLEGRLIQLNVDLNEHVKAGDVLGLVQTPEFLGKPLELKAPIDGVITERRSTVGELINKDTEVYMISDPADLWVLAEIKERDIGAVQTGQTATFTTLAYPQERFTGQLVLLGNRVETASRTLEARIAVANPAGRLKPGMFVDVEIATTALHDVLVISDDALQEMDEERIVFVALSETKFEKRVVKTGQEQHGRVQVLEGIKSGERVVTEGSFILKSELLKGELGEEG